MKKIINGKVYDTDTARDMGGDIVKMYDARVMLENVQDKLDWIK